MRLVRHIAPGESSPKSIALRTTIRNDFRSKKFLTNEIEIENAKASAVRALSNFLLANSAPKDPKVHSAMKDFHGRSVQDAKNHNATTNDSDNNNQQERQQKE